MTIPSTNIQLSAVNIELGNTSTASINLNTPRVRSLGGVSTTGTAFSMSSFIAKNSTSIFGVNTSDNYIEPTRSYPLIATPSSDQAPYYIAYTGQQFVPAQTVQVRKMFVDGSTEQIFQYSDTGVYSLATGPNATSNIYFVGGSGIVKISSNGTLLLAKQIDGASVIYRNNLLVDTAENIYCNADDVIAGATQDVITSLDSSLNFRWAKYLPDTPTANYVCAKMGLDASNNLYVQYGNFQGNANTRVGYLKFNSSGTLLQQLEGYIDASPANDYYNTSGGVNSSGQFAIGIIKDLNIYGSEKPGVVFFNSSGVVQWVRTLNAPAASYGAFSVQKVAVDVNANVYVISTYDDNITNLKPLLITKFDSSGNVVWNRRLTGGYTFPPPSLSGFVLFGYIGVNDCFLTGSNQEILSLGLYCGYFDLSYSYVDPVLFTVRTDGSGTGTYTTSGRTFYYDSISVTASSNTFTTTTSASLASVSLTTSPIAISAVTPTSYSTYSVNI